uniref:38K protein n=1 Tax=Faxonius propinquus nudivirus TaxID=3139431 RepID=A0AAU8GD07_9VIRU
MKSLAFISFHGYIDKEWIYPLLKYLNITYSIVYIVHGESIQKLLSEDNELFTKNAINNELNDIIDYKLVFISYINPKINNYSIRIFINMPEKIINDEIKCNIHIDYTIFQIDSIKNLITLYRELTIKQKIFLNNIKDFSLNASVIVYDLDDTIVDNEGELLTDNILKIINESNKLFTFHVLWSHGNTRHVTFITETKLKNIKFDLIITRLEFSNFHNKGFGYVFKKLNSIFGVGSISYNALIDDQALNFIGDYDCFIHVSKQKNKYILSKEYRLNFNKMKKYIKETFIEPKIKEQLNYSKKITNFINSVNQNKNSIS